MRRERLWVDLLANVEEEEPPKCLFIGGRERANGTERGQVEGTGWSRKHAADAVGRLIQRDSSNFREKR
jgi:hypothetical protein